LRDIFQLRDEDIGLEVVAEESLLYIRMSGAKNGVSGTHQSLDLGMPDSTLEGSKTDDEVT
jgi:hypothetical protein